MRNRFSALTISFILLTLALSFASGSAYSDECDRDTPVPDVTVSSVNGQPEPKSLDLQVQRMNGAPIEVTIALTITRRVNWCMRGYFGPLTFTWPNLPEDVTVVFEPVTLDPHTNYKAQLGHLRLSIPASVPDRAFLMRLDAAESRVRVPPFRIVLSTKPN